MLFDALIPTCYHPGKTIDDGTIGVRVESKPDEKVIFFDIDDKSPIIRPVIPQFRKKLKYDGMLCDALVYLYKCDINPAWGAQRGIYNGDINPINVVCLLEFKGSHVDDAAKQITDTLKLIKAEYANKKCFKEFNIPKKYKACIFYKSASPVYTDDAEDLLKEYFTDGDWIIICAKEDQTEENISDFLRNNT